MPQSLLISALNIRGYLYSLSDNYNIDNLDKAIGTEFSRQILFLKPTLTKRIKSLTFDRRYLKSKDDSATLASFICHFLIKNSMSITLKVIRKNKEKFCKIRQQAPTREKVKKEKQLVLTIDDLSQSLRDYGITIKKPEYFAETIPPQQQHALAAAAAQPTSTSSSSSTSASSTTANAPSSSNPTTASTTSAPLSGAPSTPVPETTNTSKDSSSKSSLSSSTNGSKSKSKASANKQ
eukprot:gene14359-16945_t